MYVNNMTQLGFSRSDFHGYESSFGKLFACTGMTLGFYYFLAARENDLKFAKRSVLGRLLIFALMIVAKLPHGLLFLGLSDAMGALWTLYYL